jgi:hypothetical protein
VICWAKAGSANAQTSAVAARAVWIGLIEAPSDVRRLYGSAGRQACCGSMTV